MSSEFRTDVKQSLKVYIIKVRVFSRKSMNISEMSN